MTEKTTAKAISDCLESHQADPNGFVLNVVDILASLDGTLDARLDGLRDAICRPGVPANCPSLSGGMVGDLTESVLSISASIVLLAGAVQSIADKMMNQN